MLIPSLMFALVPHKLRNDAEPFTVLIVHWQMSLMPHQTPWTQRWVKHPLVVIQTCFNACSVIRAGVFLCIRKVPEVLSSGWEGTTVAGYSATLTSNRRDASLHSGMRPLVERICRKLCGPGMILSRRCIKERDATSGTRWRCHRNSACPA